MSSAIQNRLVGTIIIVALAVIFLPDILDGKKQTNQAQFASVPERPAMGPVVEAKPFPIEQVKEDVIAKNSEINDPIVDEDPESTMSEEAPGSDIDTSGTKPSQTNNADPVKLIDRKVADPNALAQETQIDTNQNKLLEQAGWVVQLGVFRHQKNVRELLTKLRNAGYRAFSRPVETKSGTLTKVFVGPDLDKQKLEKALPHLHELTRLQGRVTPFTVK